MEQKILCIYDMLQKKVRFEIPEDSVELHTFEALGILESVKAEVIRLWQNDEE